MLTLAVSDIFITCEVIAFIALGRNYSLGQISGVILLKLVVTTRTDERGQTQPTCAVVPLCFLTNNIGLCGIINIGTAVPREFCYNYSIYVMH